MYEGSYISGLSQEMVYGPKFVVNLHSKVLGPIQ